MTEFQRAFKRIDDDHHAWIFISHASDDLLRVREVRNYLESKGASPLLFHLKALANPEEFWPIIEREIAARNFFLYCQSAVADEREWVRRERAAVEATGRERPIRVDSIRVDGGDLDFTKLDAFLEKTRVYASCSHEDREVVRPFLLAMERAGFQVFDETKVATGEPWQDRINREFEAAARDGWVVFFLSPSITSNTRDRVRAGRRLDAKFMARVRAGRRLGAKFIPVLLKKPQAEFPFEFVDATVDRAPDRLVELMLRR